MAFPINVDQMRYDLALQCALAQVIKEQSSAVEEYPVPDKMFEHFSYYLFRFHDMDEHEFDMGKFSIQE